MAEVQPGYIVFGTGDPSYVATLAGNNTYTGKAIFKPATDDIGTFEIQDDTGVDVFRVDTVNKWVVVGDRDITDFDPNVAFYVAGDNDSYYALNVLNASDGTTSSADICAGNDLEDFIDCGITSSTNADPTYPILQGGVAYLWASAGDLAVGSGAADTILFAGGFESTNEVVRLTGGQVKIMDGTSSLYAILDAASIASADKTFTFPNATGTFALQSAINDTFVIGAETLTFTNGILTGVA